MPFSLCDYFPVWYAICKNKKNVLVLDAGGPYGTRAMCDFNERTKCRKGKISEL